MGFLRRKRAQEHRQPDLYAGLRKQVLHLTQDQLGDDFAGAPILALLMETGYPETVATLVGVADGTSSLYFSSGGGVIGAGAHAAVADATARWLETGVTVLPRLSVFTEDPPVPGQGMTQVVAVTPKGRFGAVAPEAELGEGRHELSQFFYAAQDVITQIRLAEGS